MRQQNRATPRKNQAWKVAYWPDVQRIHSVPTLSKICQAWTIDHTDQLSVPARKLLRYLAALNLTGSLGYVGVAVAYQLLAPKIAEVLDTRGFSVRTLERAVHDLKMAGLIEVRSWVREAQYFRSGKRNVFMCGAGTVTLKNGAVVTRRLAIVTLTDLALSFWEPQRKKKVKGSHMSDNVSDSITAAKMADRSPRSEKIDKSIILTNHDSQVVTVSEVVNGDKEGRPTCPTTSRTTPSTVEHRASTGDERLLPVSDPIAHGTGSLGKAPLSAYANAPLPQSGCTKPRPAEGNRGPQASSSAAIAQTLILATLWDMLQKHSPREADSIYTRAKAEMEGALFQGWPTTVDWDYWKSKWAFLSPRERDIKVCNEILPLLKTRQAIRPDDKQKRLFESEAPAERPVPKTKDGKVILQSDFLKGLAGRLGMSDKFG